MEKIFPHVREDALIGKVIIVNMILCITILCNNVLFYHYRLSQEDGSMPCDKPVNVLYLLFYCAKMHLHYVIVHAIDK